MTSPRTALLSLACLACLTGPAAADDLVAVSNTAMAVTGDIQFDDFGMTFEDGTIFAFSELVDDSFVVDGRPVPASVYLAEAPSDPVLLNGNRLCGQGRVTYVATWSGSGEGTVIVAVFDTQDVPGSSADMCASYTYEYLY